MFFRCIHTHIYLLCLSMSWESTFVSQTLSYFLAKFFYLVNHNSVILPSRSCGSLFYRFCLSTWLFIFYLGHFIIFVFFVALGTTWFVVSRYLIKDILLMLSSSSHNLIPLLVIWGSASHYLFGLTRRLWLHSMTTLKS
jgi:hypothetical protein